jgi:hypothetical protein
LAEVSGFSSFLSFLVEVDAFTLLFPFVLAWMLFYVAIERTGLFDESNLNRFVPVISLVMAFFTARFLVEVSFYQSFFSFFFGKIVIGLTAILGLFTLLQFAGVNVGNNDQLNTGIKWLAALMAGAAFIWAGGFGPSLFGPEETQSGLMKFLSGFSELLLGNGVIWLIIIAAPLAYLMFMDLGSQTGTTSGDGNGDGS